MDPQIRQFKYDRWLKVLGGRIPEGSPVEIMKFCTRRRVLVRFRGEIINTMLWCVPKPKQNWLE